MSHPFRPHPSENITGWVQVTKRISVRASFIEKVVNSLGVDCIVLRDGSQYEVTLATAHIAREELGANQ